MAEQITFKDTYVIDMNTLKKRPFACLQNGVVLPVEQKNGKPDTTDLTLFSKRAEICIAHMIEEYPTLSQKLGDQEARTIIVYVSKANKPIMTLFPTNDTDVITNIWNDVDDGVLPDATAIMGKRQEMINKFKERNRTKK